MEDENIEDTATEQNETPSSTQQRAQNIDPGVELLHEMAAAALAGVGMVLNAKFTHETLTGSQRKYNTTR